MNALLLGNGFDLHYKLPSRYINFLNTIDYITHNSWTDVKTVGDIFKEEGLQKRDKYIAESYEAHKELYHKSDLNMDIIERLSSMATTNMWFLYLSQSYNQDIGWIDFEKQISSVIDAFKDFFRRAHNDF